MDLISLEKAYIQMVEATARLGLELLLIPNQVRSSDHGDLLYEYQQTTNRFTIKVNNVLPRLRTSNVVKLYWRTMIEQAVHNCSIDFGHLIVLIVIESDLPDWDADNRGFKWILDSLRYTNIKNDDNYRDITLIVKGKNIKGAANTYIHLINEVVDLETYLLEKSD